MDDFTLKKFRTGMLVFLFNICLIKWLKLKPWAVIVFTAVGNKGITNMILGKLRTP